jgi:transposase
MKTKPKKRRQRLPELPRRPYMTRKRFATLMDERRFEEIFNFVADRACQDANLALAYATSTKSPYYWERAFRVINGAR